VALPALAAAGLVVVPRSPAGAVPGGGATMQLLSQTPWVGPGGMAMSLGIDTAVPASGLALDVVLYRSLETRSGFEESLHNASTMGSVVLSSQTVPLDKLAATSTAGGWRLDVHFTVSPGFATSSGPLAPLTLGGCAAVQCDGVYPMQVQLLDRQLNDKLLAGFTTYLVYAASEQQTIPLDVGLVMPVGAQPVLSPDGSSELTIEQMDSLESVLGELETYPEAPVDVSLSSQLALALSRAHGRIAHAVLTRLRVVARQRSALDGAPVHELLAAPFAPAGLGALVHAGLVGDVARQLRRNADVARTVLGVDPLSGVLDAAGGVDSATLSALAGAGIEDLVLPARGIGANPVDATFAGKLLLEPPAASGGAAGSAVTTGSTVTTGSAGAATRAPGGGAVAVEPVVFASDPGLTPFFETRTADPVLAAHQLLAELALIFFEAPDASLQRAVVAAPSTWDAGPEFAAALLGGLTPAAGEPRPLARAEPLSALFSLPPANGYSPARARLVPATPVPPAGLATLVTGARHAVQVLDSVAPALASRRQPLEDAILMSESSALSPAQRDGYVDEAPAAVRAEGSTLRIPGSGQITLTSASGSIPITIACSAPTELDVVVRLTSTSGLTSLSPPLRIAVHGNRQVTVRVGARTSGVFGLRVALTSPLGGVVLRSREFRVLSTAVSPVAIALSVGALLVLALWWVRSSRRRRREGASGRRGRAPAGTGGTGPGPGPDSGGPAAPVAPAAPAG
jgi:hypothetical protein